MKVFLIPIQSYSDIITNSSSELFVVASDIVARDLEKILDKIYKEDFNTLCKLYNKNRSWKDIENHFGNDAYDKRTGDGGECRIEVLDKKKAVHYIRKCDRYKYKNSIVLKVVIDMGRKRSIQYLKNNFPILYYDNLS